MLRFYYCIIIGFPLAVYYMIRLHYVMHHMDSYSFDRRYRIARNIVRSIMLVGRIRTKSYGQENLPEEGGYVIYPNHQGKFDALGIVISHDKPCTIMMDEKRSHLPLANEIMTILEGCRLDKTSMRSQMESMISVSKEVKDGRRYIIFPEGGYFHNRNNVQDFLPGAFKTAMKAKAPVVPVALIDSYKPFEINSIRRVTTQVHYLKPLYYEDYKDLNTIQVASIVKERIVDCLRSILGEEAMNIEVDKLDKKDKPTDWDRTIDRIDELPK